MQPRRSQRQLALQAETQTQVVDSQLIHSTMILGHLQRQLVAVGQQTLTNHRFKSF
jgi:hypothetical protein